MLSSEPLFEEEDNLDSFNFMSFKGIINILSYLLQTQANFETWETNNRPPGFGGLSIVSSTYFVGSQVFNKRA